MDLTTYMNKCMALHVLHCFTKLVLQCSAFGFAENALCFRSFSVASCSLTGHTICETTGCDTTGVHKQCGHSFHKLSDLILPSV